MINDAYWPFVYHLWRNVYSRLWSILKIWLLFFCCWVVGFFIYSLPFCRLPFHSVDYASWDAELFKFDVVPFIFFLLLLLCFWYHIQEFIAKSDSWSFSPIFFPRSFYSVMCFIQFELIFVYGKLYIWALCKGPTLFYFLKDLYLFIFDYAGFSLW